MDDEPQLGSKVLVVYDDSNVADLVRLYLDVVVSAGSSSDEMVRVAVADTGRGIPSEDLSRVFDRFFRTDPSRNRATDGVGLGLTIAKQLMEVHGETIHVDNIVPCGTRFVFELPLAAKDSPAFRERENLGPKNALPKRAFSKNAFDQGESE